MPVVELTPNSIIDATGWTGATKANLENSDNTRATDGDPDEFISAEITDAPFDFDSQTSVVLRVEARVTGTVSRDKQLLVELRDSAETVLESFNTGNLTATDALYSSGTLTRSDSLATINGYRVRCTVVEVPGGMPDSAKVEIDQARVSLDYTAASGADTDNFNRGDSNTLGGLWVEQDTDGGVFRVLSNLLRTNSKSSPVARGFAYYNRAVGGKQVSEIIYKAEITGAFAGPAIRIASAGTLSSATMYAAIVDKGGTPDLRLHKWVAQDFNIGAGNQVAVSTYNVQANDLIRVEGDGTRLRVWAAGYEKIDATDGDITGGFYGMACPNVSGFSIIGDWDDWRGWGEALPPAGSPYYYNWRRRVA